MTEGPRIRVQSSDVFEPASLWVLGNVSRSGPGSVVVRDGPARIVVGSEQRGSLRIIIRETRANGTRVDVRTTTYVIVPVRRGQSALITMEAPAAKFDSYRPLFDAALKSASFRR